MNNSDIYERIYGMEQAQDGSDSLDGLVGFYAK